MAYRKWYLILLFGLLLLFLVPAAHAQQDLDVQDILGLLGPRTGNLPNTSIPYEDHVLFLDLLLYAVFFFALINMFLIPDKQLLASMLNFLVIGLIVVSKLVITPCPERLGKENPACFVTDYQLSSVHIVVLPINAGIFVIPLTIAGMVRKTSKYAGPPPAMYTGALAGLLGGGYFFLFWALEQRNFIGAAASILTRLFH
jgi:hypothetical protein